MAYRPLCSLSLGLPCKYVVRSLPRSSQSRLRGEGEGPVAQPADAATAVWVNSQLKTKLLGYCPTFRWYQSCGCPRSANYTEFGKNWCSRLRECCRQGGAEAISKCSSKIRQTWSTDFSQSLHMYRESLKKPFPGCVNISWNNCVFLPAVGNKTQLYQPISHNLGRVFRGLRSDTLKWIQWSLVQCIGITFTINGLTGHHIFRGNMQRSSRDSRIPDA